MFRSRGGGLEGFVGCEFIGVKIVVGFVVVNPTSGSTVDIFIWKASGGSIWKRFCGRGWSLMK